MNHHNIKIFKSRKSIVLTAFFVPNIHLILKKTKNPNPEKKAVSATFYKK